MRIVILGSGRVGARVARALSVDHDVTVIDRSSSAFERLGADFAGRTIQGNGIDVDVLRHAGTEYADVFLSLTEVDNANIMAAEVAHELGARRVVTRLYDPSRSGAFDSSDIVAISPTVIGANALFDLVTGEEVG
jgi:trk system potassium uptake protein